MTISEKAPVFKAFSNVADRIFLVLRGLYLFRPFPPFNIQREVIGPSGSHPAAFCCPKNGKDAKRMVLRYSSEPKHRYLALIGYFAVKGEPSWLTKKIHPKRRRNGFPPSKSGNRMYSLRGTSHGITSRDFVCQSPNQKPPHLAT